MYSYRRRSYPEPGRNKSLGLGSDAGVMFESLRPLVLSYRLHATTIRVSHRGGTTDCHVYFDMHNHLAQDSLTGKALF
jgi:hypothetical protein